MPEGFSATQVSVSRDDGVLIVALGAPSTEQDDHYLMLQRNDRETEEEARLGMNMPYVEFCGQGWSWYGHILQALLERNAITIHMNSNAAQRMRNDGVVHVTFSLNEEQFSRVKSALREVFRGEGYYAEA